MFYYIFLFCLLYGFWDGYKKISENKERPKLNTQCSPENYTGLLDFLISNK